MAELRRVCSLCHVPVSWFTPSQNTVINTLNLLRFGLVVCWGGGGGLFGGVFALTITPFFCCHSLCTWRVLPFTAVTLFVQFTLYLSGEPLFQQGHQNLMWFRNSFDGFLGPEGLLCFVLLLKEWIFIRLLREISVVQKRTQLLLLSGLETNCCDTWSWGRSTWKKRPLKSVISCNRRKKGKKPNPKRRVA